MHIFIVEDDHLMLDVYKTWLAHILPPSSGVTVQFASNGNEAENLLKRNTYDLTLLDLSLPDVDGATLALTYREHMGRLVLATTCPELSKATCALADTIMTKPFSRNDLSGILKLQMEVSSDAYESPNRLSQKL